MNLKQTIDILIKKEQLKCAARSIVQKQNAVKQLNTPYVTTKQYESVKLKALKLFRKFLGK